MQSYTRKRAYLEAHIAVLLWGITAILGDVITLSALALVWWRVCITSIVLFPLSTIGSYVLDSSRRREVLLIVFAGFILGLHWLTFFATVKLANASVTLICMSTTPLFTALLEAVVQKRSVRKRELYLGSIIIPAMVFVASDLTSEFHLGFAVGIISASLSALSNALNKKISDYSTAYNITLIQMVASTLLLGIFLVGTALFSSLEVEFFPTQLSDIFSLLFLSIFCTACTFILMLRSYRHLTGFMFSLIVSLEPVYGIIFAALLLNDLSELNSGFYLGGILILSAIFADAYLNYKSKVITT